MGLSDAERDALASAVESGYRIFRWLGGWPSGILNEDDLRQEAWVALLTKYRKGQLDFGAASLLARQALLGMYDAQRRHRPGKRGATQVEVVSLANYDAANLLRDNSCHPVDVLQSSKAVSGLAQFQGTSTHRFLELLVEGYGATEAAKALGWTSGAGTYHIRRLRAYFAQHFESN